MTGVNNINPAVTNVKTNKGKKAGAALGAATGLGVTGSVAYLRKDAFAKDVKKFVDHFPKDTVNWAPAGKPIIKNIPKKTVAVLECVAKPVAKLGLAAAAAGAVIGVVGGAIADKIASRKAQ